LDADGRQYGLLPRDGHDHSSLRPADQPASVSRLRRHVHRRGGARASPDHRSHSRPRDFGHERGALQPGRHAQRAEAILGNSLTAPSGRRLRPGLTNEERMRAVIYARYSTELQRDASIEDQVRLCKTRIDDDNWVLVGTYADHALSGASHLRP